MLAEIITIGDEILIGQTIDTNSAWLGIELNAIGIDVERISSIRDTPQAILKALDEAEQRADIILLTGGLGPTKDDITKKTLAQYFNVKLVQNQEVLEHVTSIFRRYNRPILQVNLDQALVPDKCQVLHNAKGTAPGMLFKKPNCIIISMPGVPYEMKYIMKSHVLPLLSTLENNLSIVHKTITVVDIPESLLSAKIEHIESNLPEFIKLAYLPHLNLVRLRLTGKSRRHTEHELESEINGYFNEIKQLIENSWFEGDSNLGQIIGNMLIESKQTIGTIESCTGGFIAHSITINPGSSAYFLGGIVSYSNQYKIDLIGVDQELFTTVGSVSTEVARQMALKGQSKLGVDYCLSATGIAGPSGATETKEVGLVYIGLALPQGECKVVECHFRGNRQQIIERTAYTALNLVRQAILEFSQNEQKPVQQL